MLIPKTIAVKHPQLEQNSPLAKHDKSLKVSIFVTGGGKYANLAHQTNTWITKNF